MALARSLGGATAFSSTRALRSLASSRCSAAQRGTNAAIYGVVWAAGAEQPALRAARGLYFELRFESGAGKGYADQTIAYAKHGVGAQIKSGSPRRRPAVGSHPPLSHPIVDKVWEPR